MSRLRELFTRTSKGYYGVHAPTMAAAMSYFALATVAPLGVLTIWVSELLRQSATTEALQGALFFVFGQQLGQDLARLVVSESQVGLSRVGGALAVLFLLYGAASLFLATQRALNVVWHIRLARSAGLGVHVAIRAVIVFATVFMPFAAILILGVARDVLGVVAKTANAAKLPGYSYGIAVHLLAAAAIWGLVAVVYRVLPDARLTWRSILVGAAFTSVTWMLGTWVFTLYFSLTNASRYQLAGSAIAALVWIFLMSQLFLAGARLAYEHASMRGAAPDPRPWAELYEQVPERE